MSFAQGLVVVLRWRCIPEKSEILLRWDLNPGPLSICSFMTGKTLSYQIRADLDLKPTLFRSFIKDRPPTLKSSQFRPPTRKTRSISMLTLKPSDLQPASEKQVNFDNPHKNRVSRSPTKNKSISARTVNFDPPHKIQVDFDPNAKTQSNSIHHTKVNFISTPPMKSSQFDPHSKTKSILIQTQTKYFPTPTQKLSHFRSIH